MTTRSSSGTPPPAASSAPCAGTRPRSGAWRSARTAARLASAGGDRTVQDLGCRHRPGSSAPSAGTRTRSLAWRTAPTAAPSPPPARTTPSSSGTPPPARRCAPSAGIPGRSCGVAYSPDGRTLASASRDHTVKLWDAATGQVVRTLRGHAEPVHGVAFSPDGRRIASASFDRTIKLWDAATGQELPHACAGIAGSVLRRGVQPGRPSPSPPPARTAR